MSGYVPWIVPLAVAFPAAAIVVLRRTRTPSLPLADAPALGGSARRTAAVRTGLAACLVALLAVTSGVAGRPDEPMSGILGEGSATVIVLDVSASVSDLVYQNIARTLQGIVEAAGDGRRVGLVLFSDVAEEALPPGTRAEELRPFIRFFLPRPEPGVRRKPPLYAAAGPGAPPQIPYPLSPWLRTFSAGTRISTGLAAARRALDRDAAGGGRVVLLSDLAEAEEDVGALTHELLEYARRPGLSLSVVGLPPATDQETAIFERILGERQSVVSAASLTADRASDGSPPGRFPAWLVVLVALLGLALAVNELLAQPLSWRRPAGEEAA